MFFNFCLVVLLELVHIYFIQNGLRGWVCILSWYQQNYVPMYS